MATKVKKSVKRPAKKSSARKAPAKKPAKKSSAKKPSARRNPLAPVTVNTGRGPTPAEIGADLVSMFNSGKWSEIEEKWWDHKKITSVEGMGVNLAWIGRKAVDIKNSGWVEDHSVHGASAEGPFVGSSGFSVKFKMDVETKGTGQREVMEEVGVYTVENGKIVREEFMYMMR